MNQILSVTKQPIKVLHFTKWSAILIELESSTTTQHFKTYCKDNNLLACICPSAKILPHTYQLVMKIILCDGTFAPEDEDQLHAIEADHKLEEGTIISAAWIKKPELHSPNQKTANVKVICSSLVTANQLLLGRVFIANSRVIIIKDVQEPIQCNKCQEYGHIWAFCVNEECCATCARPHDTYVCSYHDDRHCVSCGTSSDHSSLDKDNCPQFAKHYASLDTRVPENSLLYFLVLGSPWTFSSTAKSPPPPPPKHQHANQLQLVQPQRPPPTYTNAHTSCTSLTQTTLDVNRCLIPLLPPSHSPDPPLHKATVGKPVIPTGIMGPTKQTPTTSH